MKRCPKSLFIWEIYIKATEVPLYTLRIIKMEVIDNTKCW